ncbi:MAG TPA: cytochrome c biogenesis protein CcsA [Bacteroidales bacterium]|nr:cytochrome c biogenesis protein CcsA [Bacteroidales bacterium]HQB56433.1 cytochrome c biogenesis protein CcsA [Bacteroidales bacterium]
MTWEHLILFACVAAVFWITGSVLALLHVKRNHIWTIVTYTAGIIIYASFIGGFWVSLQRPPFVTMGETRLWYSLFLSLAGLITYIRWKYKWILSLTTVMSLVFITVNILRPEIHNRVLMPVLQSIWFIPHVTVYMFSYALLACTFLLAIAGLLKPSLDTMPAIDKLSRAGLSFFTVGMLLGALWAKQAWGDFWTWDPKETWAAVTWLLYALFFHLKEIRPQAKKMIFISLILAFLSLQIGWYGLQYLPSAKGSMHNYALIIK